MRHAWPLLAFLLFSACPKPAAPLIPSPRERHEVSPAELAQLTVPPSPSTLDILGRLETQADEGDTEAAWQRTHYLIDLFDAVRFSGDEESRKALATISARPISAMHGSAATEAITELLMLEIDHVLELDRKHSLAGQAHALVRFDADPPSRREQVFQRIEELKRVVNKNGELSTAARLRLFAYCRVALQDAQALSGSRKREARSHCLYPLYASDPAPYFADKAEDRPPPPELSEILIDMRGLIEAQPWPRLRQAMQSQTSWLEAFSAKTAGQRSLSAENLRLPPATQVSPYDDYPLLGISTEPVPKAIAAIRGPLVADNRGVVALAYATETPAEATLRAATIATAAGADAIAVLVSSTQRLSVPKGDYGSTRIHGGSVTRVGEMYWSLALMEGHQDSNAAQEAKATHWDPSRASLRLHLEVSPKAWRLTSPNGDLRRIDTSTAKNHPRTELRAHLLAIRQAFPDEDGLILVAAPGSSHGALVAAADAARVDDNGQALFHTLAIAKEAPKRRSGKALVKRIERRAAALISVTPTILAERNPVARRCYQELHDKKRAPTGEIRMELDGKGGIKTSGRGKELALCAKKAYGGAILDGKITSATVRFSARVK